MKCERSFIRDAGQIWKMAHIDGDEKRKRQVEGAVARKGYADSTVKKWRRDNLKWAELRDASSGEKNQ